MQRAESSERDASDSAQPQKHTQQEEEYPEERDQPARDRKAAWWHALFPMIPPSFSSSIDDEAVDELLASDSTDDVSAVLFPTPESVDSYILSQSTRMLLLQAIRRKLIGNGAKQSRAHVKYASLHLDIRLLVSLSDLFAFSNSALELVHHCSSNQLSTLQANNLLLMNEILHTMCVLIQPEELQHDISQVTPEGVARPSLPLVHRVNIAERLSLHNSAEVLLTIFESLMDEVNLSLAQDAHETPSMQLTLVESILRYIATQLDICASDSPAHVATLKQLYLHIPSHQQIAPSATALPGDGSDSGIIRLLIGLVQDRRSVSSVRLAAQILSSIASTPIVNDHVHSSECKRPPEREACTRGTKPTPVVTYPVCCNSVLAVASKLFLFPHAPSLYLAERNLVQAYLDILAPFLKKPSAAVIDHTPKQQMTPLTISSSRSLFRKKGDEEDEENAGNSGSFLLGGLASPPSSRNLCHQSFVHEPHPTYTPSEDSHHASHLLSEHQFMLSYTKSPENGVHMQYPMQPAPQQHYALPTVEEAPPLVHYRAAPVFQSNELLGAALDGLAALCHGSTIISLHVANQPGFLSFAATLLVHRSVQLLLSAIRLLSEMERALALAPRCITTNCTSLAHADSPCLTAHLASVSLAKPRMSRRSSSTSVEYRTLHRRNSGAGISPTVAPMSPVLKGASFSPRLFALTGHNLPSMVSHASPPVLLQHSRTAAHALIFPLVRQCITVAVNLAASQWPELRSRAPKIGLDRAVQLRIVRLIGSMVSHSAELQTLATDAVPILLGMLSNRTQDTDFREASLISLSQLCCLHAPNRHAVIRHRVISTVILPLLAVLKPVDAQRLRDRNALVHPSVLKLQLASVRLCSTLSECFSTLSTTSSAQYIAEDATAASATAAIVNLLNTLIGFLDVRDAPLSLACAASTLFIALVSESSPLRHAFSTPKFMQQIVRLAAEPEQEEELGSCCAVNSAASEDACKSTPTLAAQLRVNALRCIASLSQHSTVEVKRLLLSLLSFEGVINLVQVNASADKSDVASPSLKEHLSQVSHCGWEILQHLLEHAPKTETFNGADEGGLFTRSDIVQALELCLARLDTSESSSAWKTLLVVAERNDFAKMVILERPQVLQLLNDALKPPGVRLIDAANLLLALVESTSDEAASSSVSASFSKRQIAVFEAKCFPSLLQLAQDSLLSDLPHERLCVSLTRMQNDLIAAQYCAHRFPDHWRALDQFVKKRLEASLSAGEPDTSSTAESGHSSCRTQRRGSRRRGRGAVAPGPAIAECDETGLIEVVDEITTMPLLERTFRRSSGSSASSSEPDIYASAEEQSLESEEDEPMSSSATIQRFSQEELEELEDSIEQHEAERLGIELNRNGRFDSIAPSSLQQHAGGRRSETEVRQLAAQLRQMMSHWMILATAQAAECPRGVIDPSSSRRT